MPQTNFVPVARRQLVCGALLLPFALSGTAFAKPPAKVIPMTVYKDPNCGCCTAWAQRVRADGHFRLNIVSTADMAAIKQRLRVPADLASCHTATVGGYVVEGHVPPADIARLVATRPLGVIGIAVPGMPAGSPGMETPDGRHDAFEVVAFTSTGKRSIFARHG